MGQHGHCGGIVWDSLVLAGACMFPVWRLERMASPPVFCSFARGSPKLMTHWQLLPLATSIPDRRLPSVAHGDTEPKTPGEKTNQVAKMNHPKATKKRRKLPEFWGCNLLECKLLIKCQCTYLGFHSLLERRVAEKLSAGPGSHRRHPSCPLPSRGW